ncbi:MAG: caspase family protein [Leptospirillia bacterium]
MRYNDSKRFFLALPALALSALAGLSACSSTTTLDYLAPQTREDVSKGVLAARRPLHFGVITTYNRMVLAPNSDLSKELTSRIIRTIRQMGGTPTLTTPDLISPDSGFDAVLKLSFNSGVSVNDISEATSAYNGKILFRIISNGSGGYARNGLIEKTSIEVKKQFSMGQRLYRKVAADRIAYLGQSGETVAGGGGGSLSRQELQALVSSAVSSGLGAEKASKIAAEAFVPKTPADTPDYRLPKNPHAYAVVIGIEKYLGGDIPPAKFASRDAQAMKRHLLAMGFPERHIHIVTNTRATQGILKAEIRWLRNNTDAQSTVFFYFSGHGAPDPNSQEAYLVTSDVELADLADTAFPLKTLYDDLNALPAKQILVALDSCFSGAGGRSVLETGARPLVAVHMGSSSVGKIVVLSAAAHDQISGITERGEHGVFTYYLLKSLNESLKDSSSKIPEVPVERLYTYVKPRVEDAARRHNRSQTPQILFHSTDPESFLLK